jgi:uncharacterized membrane protein YfcA
MSSAILIATSFSLGFFVESMIGTGGGLIAYAILGFLMNIKEMILAGLYIGTCSSGYIAYSDHKSFNKKLFISIVPVCLSGTMIGVFIFSRLDPQFLSLILGLLLILIAVKSLFFNHLILPKFLKNQLLLIGGISHGAFGIGGPFVINALQRDFKNKSELRTTMAVYFVTFNLVRILQLTLQNQISFEFLKNIWWVIIPVFIAIKLGHKVHLKISDEFLRKSILAVTLGAGLKFLLKAF